MHAETITSFQQIDEDDYLLKYEDYDGDTHSLSMHTFEAARLYQLLRQEIGEYVIEMEEARASFDAGEGPNGEPRGTWEQDELTDERDLIPVELADLMNKARKEQL